MPHHYPVTHYLWSNGGRPARRDHCLPQVRRAITRLYPGSLCTYTAQYMAMASYISRPCFMPCSCVQMVKKLVGRSSGLCAMHARARSTYAPGACSLHEGGGRVSFGSVLGSLYRDPGHPSLAFPCT